VKDTLNIFFIRNIKKNYLGYFSGSFKCFFRPKTIVSEKAAIPTAIRSGWVSRSGAIIGSGSAAKLNVIDSSLPSRPKVIGSGLASKAIIRSASAVRSNVRKT